MGLKQVGYGCVLLHCGFGGVLSFVVLFMSCCFWGLGWCKWLVCGFWNFHS